jgi:hypothetical protein
LLWPADNSCRSIIDSVFFGTLRIVGSLHFTGKLVGFQMAALDPIGGGLRCARLSLA